MSQRFFEFKIECPFCGEVENRADGYETDDWTEVFVFSGYSQKSAKFMYNENYTCHKCQNSLPIDSLYERGCVKDAPIDRIKAYLNRMYDHVRERGGIRDHGWEPDLLTALRRYESLYPDDEELSQIAQKYKNIL